MIGSILSLPSVGLYFGLHEWTERRSDLVRASIADHRHCSGIVAVRAAQHDPAADADGAFYAPAGHRATWFALMASLMNMALVAGQLQAKYLNQIFVVERGDYGELGGFADCRHDRLFCASGRGRSCYSGVRCDRIRRLKASCSRDKS